MRACRHDVRLYGAKSFRTTRKNPRSVGLLHHCISTAPSRSATARIDMPPKWLFRAYSNLSQGTNTTAIFAPKAAVKEADPRHYRGPDFEDTDKAAELALALDWSPESDHFVFFSNSLLFALAVAAYRFTKNESGINIACIDTDRVRTPSGKKVIFENAASIFSASNHPGIKNSDGSHRDYSDVFVATECVELGRAAWIASYQVLKERGLHALFPRYAPQLDRHGRERWPRLNIVVEDMRAYGFNGIHSLTAGRIDTMMHLASAFRSTERQRSTFPMHLLASFLAFKKIEPSDKVLQSWLRKNCQDVILLDEDDENELEVEQGHKDIALPPEVFLQLQVVKKLHHLQITEFSADLNAALSDQDIREERQAWETWMWNKRQLRRLRRNGLPRKPRRDLQTFRSPDKGRDSRSSSQKTDGRDQYSAKYRPATNTGSSIDGNSSSRQSRPAKKMRYRRGNDGSSLETAIPLSDSDEEAANSLSPPRDSSLQQAMESQARYSKDRKYAKRRWREVDRYSAPLRREQRGTSGKRRRFANEH